MSDKKKKKEKIKYIDDGRTIADMSGISRRPLIYSAPKVKQPFRGRAIWKTYWSAVRMMILPMFVTIGFIIILYLLLTVLFIIM